MEQNDFNNLLIIRALNEENNDFVITLGDHLASPRHFTSFEEADKVARSIDWNIAASIAMCLITGYEKMKQSNEEEDKK